MTAPIRQRVPLAASDEQVIVRRSAARHDRAMAAAGVLPAKPRHPGCGLIPLPRLSAHDRDDVTVVSLAAELDLSATAVAQTLYRPACPRPLAKTRTGAVKPALGAALRGAARYERRRYVQPRHAHGHILGAHQRAVILAPCPTSGLRRGSLYRERR
jgi:hypothetical protein